MMIVAFDARELFEDLTSAVRSASALSKFLVLGEYTDTLNVAVRHEPLADESHKSLGLCSSSFNHCILDQRIVRT